MIDKKEKKVVTLIVFCIVVFIALTHFDLVVRFFSYIGGLILPIVIGLILAFVLNVPTTGFEKLFNRMFSKRKRRPGENSIRAVSIVMSLICVALIITLLFTLVIPELVRTIKSILPLIEENRSTWISELEKFNIDTTELKKQLKDIDLTNLFKNISDNVGSVIGSIANLTSSTVSVISSSVIGFVIAIYVLFSKKTLCRQAKRILYAYCRKDIAEQICRVCSLIKDSYTKFLTGQCVEAVILGMMIFISFTIFRLPYAGLLGVVTAICSMIPYIGAFISCILGVILTLLASPEQAILCLIVYLSIQFIETQFVYPRVVGGSVGLSPLWTLLAVLLGGQLFGLIGMISFIPLVSVIYTLLKNDVETRLQKKKNEVDLNKL